METQADRVAANRAGYSLGPVHLVVSKRDERFFVEVEPHVAGGAQPQRVAEVIAVALLDENGRYAIDGAGGLGDDIATQRQARAHCHGDRARVLHSLRRRG